MTKTKPADANLMGDGKSETPLLEWIAAAVGLLLTLVTVGVIGREALKGESNQLPIISVAVAEIWPTESGYIVAFEASNKTGGTAAAVEVEAVLKVGDKVVETSKATLDYVPGRSKVKGGVFFTEDPRQRMLEIRPLGFQTP